MSRYFALSLIVPVLAGCAMSHVKETDLPYGAGKDVAVTNQEWHLLGSNSASTTNYQCTPPENEGGRGTCDVVPFSSAAHSDNSAVGEAAIDAGGLIGSAGLSGHYGFKAAREIKKGMIGASRERRPDHSETNIVQKGGGARTGPIHTEGGDAETGPIDVEGGDAETGPIDVGGGDGGDVIYPPLKPVKPMPPKPPKPQPPKPPKPCPRTGGGGCPKPYTSAPREEYYKDQGLGARMFERVY